MKVYDCKVRLAGAVANEVMKYGISAAEIEILRYMHGSDAVIDIKEAGDNGLNSVKERARLRNFYANPEYGNGDQLKAKNAMLRELFGHERLPLPETLEDIAPREEDPEAADIEVEEAAPVAPIAPVRRTRVPKPEAASVLE